MFLRAKIRGFMFHTVFNLDEQNFNLVERRAS